MNFCPDNRILAVNIHSENIRYDWACGFIFYEMIGTDAVILIKLIEHAFEIIRPWKKKFCFSNYDQISQLKKHKLK